jgi:hypothetical protein
MKKPLSIQEHFSCQPQSFFSTLPGFLSIGAGRTSNSKDIMMKVTPATAGPTKQKHLQQHEQGQEHERQ